MRTAVESGAVSMPQDGFRNAYFHWIDNLRDWCVSRQIWWGHQIPVWYKDDERYVGVQPPSFDKAQDKEGEGWQRDPDTLDTWFSSALWTWSTLVDPELADDYSLSLDELLARSPDFKAYHPTSVMETGWDILFFWVARMILSTTYAVGQIPFKQVYLHGLVRAEDGRKMSKSDPDSMIDPMEVIPEYGADALRLALVSGVNAGQDQRLGRGRIVDNRNFCNKLWNISRYIEMTAGEAAAEAAPKTPADHWILNKLSILTGKQKQNLDNFRFSEAYQELYHFVWDDLADWYVEAIKSEPNNGLLKYALENTLVLLHPFAPFITEAIWRQLGHEDLLAKRLFPQVGQADAAEAAKFEEIIEVVSFIRQVKSVAEVKGAKLFEKGSSEVIPEQLKLIEKLSNTKTYTGLTESLSQGVKYSTMQYDLWLDIDENELNKALAKLENKAEKIKETIKHLENRLNNQAYINKAPEELVEETKLKLKEEIKTLEEVKVEIEGLK
jgi:valyl-tRNA synthetase